MTAPRTTTTAESVCVDPDDLRCPGCGEQAECAPPILGQASDGHPVALFSHPDRSPLCRDRAGRIVEPVEVTR